MVKVNAKVIILFIFFQLLGWILFYSFIKNIDHSKTTDVKIKTSSGSQQKKIVDYSKIKLFGISQHYKDKDFDIKKYDTNGLTIELFNDCNTYVTKIKDQNFNLSLFFNEQLKDYNINFGKVLNCSTEGNSDICLKLNNYKPGDILTLNDVVNMIYGIYTGNFTYENYLKIISTDKINFPNMLPDLAYSKYYGLIVSKKIKTEEDCINFIYKQGGIQ